MRLVVYSISIDTSGRRKGNIRVRYKKLVKIKKRVEKDDLTLTFQTKKDRACLLIRSISKKFVNVEQRLRSPGRRPSVNNPRATPRAHGGASPRLRPRLRLPSPTPRSPRRLSRPPTFHFYFHFLNSRTSPHLHHHHRKRRRFELHCSPI